VGRDAAALVVLGGIALLGNGLKAVVTSTVLVSEAQFATFLGIAVERVALLMETIVAGMVVALAVYPLFLHRYTVRRVAMSACAVAAAAFAVFAGVTLAGATPWQREVAAYACLTLGAAALVCLAPSAQALVSRWPASEGRKVLTTLWTGATPAGFLAAPQLAKTFLPALGLSAYFAAFAALPLVLLALVAMVAAVLPAEGARDRRSASFPLPVIAAFVGAVAAFELWSTLGSIVGYAAPATLASLPLLAAATVWLWRRAAPLPRETPVTPATWPLLGALFVLQMPTTGFFEAAFLFDRGMSDAFVADRATLYAAASVAGTFAAGLALHRYAGGTRLVASAWAMAAAGLAAFAAYPWIDDPAYYLWTAGVSGAGVGALTLFLCVAIVTDAPRVTIVAALPSIAIMIGTEFGLEILQLVFAAAQGAGLAARGAFRVLFVAQGATALLVLPLLLAGARAGAPAAADQ